MIEISGHEAVLEAQKPFNMPSVCCRCGSASTKTLSSVIQVTGLGRKTRTVTFPYCAACADRAATVGRARLMLYLSVMAIAGVVACIGLLVPGLSKGILIVVPCALAIFAGIVLRSNAGESVDSALGAWLTKATSKQTTFFMANGEWAKSFAAANQIPTLAPVIKKQPTTVWPVGLIVAGIVATIIAVCVQPSVYIDNEGTAPLQVWVDGKKSIVVDPIHEQLVKRPSTMVPYGKHRFGWSPVGAAAPVAQTEPTKIELAGNHLYNPGETACYFLELSTYGKSETVKYLTGPVPLAELYTFSHVDNWFSENPDSVSTKASSEVRTALKPFRVCKEYVDHGCATQVRADLMTCLQDSYVKDAPKEVAAKCFVAAENACSAPPRHK